jgi:predicted O-methyltransferase YrrM
MTDARRASYSGLIPVSPNGFWAPRHSPARSLRRTAALFDLLGGQTIVEIGSGLHGPAAGNSLLVWTEHTAATRIIAVDPDPQQIAAVAEVTARSPQVEAVCDEGLAYLARHPGPIDLLYLDFWVRGPDGAVQDIAEGYRETYQAARAKLSPQSLILIDDTDHVPPWKHTLLVPEACRDGYTVVYTGRQTLLRREASRG